MREFNEEHTAEFERFLEHMRQLPKASMFVMNFEQMGKMNECAKIMKDALTATNSSAEIFCEQSDCDNTFGVVRVEGATVYMTDAEQFAVAAGLANHTEIYPLAENKVRVEFTFHHLMKPIG